MKEVVRTYGSMIIASMVALALIYIICLINYNGDSGILAIVGSITSKETSQILIDDNEMEEYRKYRNSQIEHVNFKDDLEIFVCEKYLVADCFVSDSGQVSPDKISIIEIRDVDNNSIMFQRENEKDYFYFVEPGIFRVYFSVSNNCGVLDYGSLFLPVNRKKGE